MCKSQLAPPSLQTDLYRYHSLAFLGCRTRRSDTNLDGSSLYWRRNGAEPPAFSLTEKIKHRHCSDNAVFGGG